MFAQSSGKKDGLQNQLMAGGGFWSAWPTHCAHVWDRIVRVAPTLFMDTLAWEGSQRELGMRTVTQTALANQGVMLRLYHGDAGKHRCRLARGLVVLPPPLKTMDLGDAIEHCPTA